MTILEQLQQRKAELEPQVANLLALSDELRRITNTIRALTGDSNSNVVPGVGGSLQRPLESGRVW